jgi:23S rRNA pseudouridine1911/1915/1917 synthase
MSGKKRGSPKIPPGAPGHPREPQAESGEGRVRHGDGHAKRDDSRQKGQVPAHAKRRGRAQTAVVFLYEDDDLIAVDKPEGLAVIAPEGSRARTLYDIVTDHLQRTNPKARAAVVHRIDRGTSGLVVFAKSGEAKRLLMGNWDELVSERRYSALVEGRMEGASGVLDSWLAEEGPSRMRQAAPGERGAKRALTRWRLVAEGARYSLVELALETGRKHQIRVQLAGIGHPVAGDDRYGARTDPLGRLCLHAQFIALENPLSGKVLRLESPCPPEFRRLALSSRAGR